ncbi:MAG: hypothetical protein ACKVUT_16855 [Gaiella sp.]
MRVGTQFSGTIAAGATGRWFTHSWSPTEHVVWTVIPTTPGPGAPQLEWAVQVQRASATALTYWITIHNLVATPVDFEMRFEVMN